MPAKTVDEAKQVVLAALPTSGEVEYETLYNTLNASGERVAIRQFHTMRKKGELTTRLDGGKLYVSRA